MTPIPPKRAPKGSIDSLIHVRLSASLRVRLEAAAKKEGLSMAEWVRQAIEPLLPEE